MRRLAALTAAALVATVAPVVTPPAGATPGPANAPEYWFDSWRISDLWSQGIKGRGITIAVVDTGVNAALPQLRGKVLAGTNLGSAGGDGRIDRDVDEFGHGTAMASIMVADPGPFGITGLAPSATVLPVAVPLNGTTDVGADDRLPQAIRYAADHGANIINLSLGGKRTPSQDGVACPPDEQDAVYHALREGVIVVAAAGNDGPTHNAIEEPGVCLGVIAVGAVDASGTVAPFSSREPYLTVSAPGVNVPSLSRVPGVGYSGDGTSQAAALVSAVLALVWSAHRAEPAQRIVTRLLATLVGRRSRPSPAYGYGQVDAYRAVSATVAADAANPVYSAAAPFLARAGACAAATRAPSPAASGPAGEGGFGSYRVGAPPRQSASSVGAGVTTAVTGLVLLVALLLLALRTRRRAAHAAAGSAASGPPPAVAPPFVKSPVVAPPPVAPRPVV
ncbi:MAG: S8 family peptidase, partial [Jatrophihabitans sp.]|uniref:S8 family peptidase n=1 Tax=Jatrophihabitans sp. TaxID=1932789 RepID=UPI003F81018F